MNIYAVIIFLFFMAGVLLLVLMILGFLNLRKKSALEFAFVTLCQAVLVLIKIPELLAPDPEWVKGIYNIGIIAITSLSPLILLFMLRFSDKDKYITPLRILYLFLIPLMTVFLFWTNDLHHLFWKNVTYTRLGIYLLRTTEFGSWFWVNIIYTYVMLILATVIMVRKILTSPHLFGAQAKLLLVAALLPVPVHLLFIFKILYVPGVDISPLAFLLSSVFMFVGIYRYHVFTIIPVARDLLLENMFDGILVIDRWKRILDYNGKFYSMIPDYSGSLIGLSMNELKLDWFCEVEILLGENYGRKSLDIQRDNADYHYNIRVAPVFKRKILFGYIIIFQDITLLKRKEEELQRMAITDYLTGAYNRRYFSFLANKSYYHAVRFKHPVSVFILEIDSFNEVNDRFSHEAGDEVLKWFFELCSKNMGSGHILGRYEGVKFILFLPDTDYRGAEIIAQRIFQRAHYKEFIMESGKFQISVSIAGLSCIPGEGDDLEGVIRQVNHLLLKLRKAGGGNVLIDNNYREMP